MDQESVNLPGAARKSDASRWALIIAGLLVVGVYVASSRPVPPPPGWSSDFAGASSEASQSGRPLLVAFHMSSCPPCVAMDRTVLRSEAVQHALSSFVPVRVNADTDWALARRFGVGATPTYAIITPPETVVARVEGFQAEDDFLAFLSVAAGKPTS